MTKPESVIRNIIGDNNIIECPMCYGDGLDENMKTCKICLGSGEIVKE